ncbi:hypothetical protein [Halomonas sp. M4R1S46]|uniref:hypothetical protein n=1 Tax=Halomonas sp. M4R1S46 TaxID=2982692 RepID=UPI0021E389E5|nr:hypothetical protein [Halomonas sp. M4R1S46]UYG09559.1 hypothetical protein OCT48_09575 [Halomonas sp. M4R1S46]
MENLRAWRQALVTRPKPHCSLCQPPSHPGWRPFVLAAKAGHPLIRHPGRSLPPAVMAILALREFRFPADDQLNVAYMTMVQQGLTP